MGARVWVDCGLEQGRPNRKTQQRWDRTGTFLAMRQGQSAQSGLALGLWKGPSKVHHWVLVGITAHWASWASLGFGHGGGMSGLGGSAQG